MVTSNECWLKDSCKKFNNGECEDGAFCIKLFKLDYLYNQALITNKQRQHVNLRIDADGTDKDKFLQLKQIEDNIEKFVTSGSNLFLYSKICGNGKTAWSLRLLQAYFNSIWHKSGFSCRALFINVPRYLLELKANISHESSYIARIHNYVQEADIVVWDDIATKTATEFEHENLLSIINSRLDNNKSNIFTSNMNDEELYSTLGARLASRITGFSTCIELKGMDKRGIK
jgi:DNA replication protein DnaC